MKDDGRTQFQLRIDGFPEAIADPEEKISRETILNHDSSEILKIFEYMEERPGINDIQRLGKVKKDQEQEVGNKQGSEI